MIQVLADLVFVCYKILYLPLVYFGMIKVQHFTLIFLSLLTFGKCNSQLKVDLESSYFIEIPRDTTITLDHKELHDIGGISGIDYDRKNGQYLLISDAGKKHGNSRYYTVDIKFKPQISIDFKDVHYLANNELRGEGVRITPSGMLLTDERTIDDKERSFVFQYGDDGRSEEIPLPTKFQQPMWDNSGFEGLAFSEKNNKMYIALERAMPESLDRYTVSILEYDLDNLSLPPVEYYYPLQRKLEGNGISEIMIFDDSSLLVVERDWVSPNNYVSIYEVQLDGKPSKVLDPKKVFTFDNVTHIGGMEFKINNIEGITMSPNQDYLILASDNNFGNKCNCTPTQLVFLKVD